MHVVEYDNIGSDKVIFFSCSMLQWMYLCFLLSVLDILVISSFVASDTNDVD